MDFVRLTPNGDCHLTISDHLEWEEKFPDAVGKKVVIEAISIYPASDLGFKSLSQLQKAMHETGHNFRYKILRTMIN